MSRTKILMFHTENGVAVAVEALMTPGEEERMASAGEIVEQTNQRFSDALRGVEAAAQEILSGFAESLKPEQLELTFGLKFNAKVGVILASADTEASMTLKATWKPSTKNS